MNINVDAFLETLPIMGKGMLGIFLVTLTIVICIILLNKITSNDNNNDDNE